MEYTLHWEKVCNWHNKIEQRNKSDTLTERGLCVCGREKLGKRSELSLHATNTVILHYWFFVCDLSNKSKQIDTVEESEIRSSEQKAISPLSPSSIIIIMIRRFFLSRLSIRRREEQQHRHHRHTATVVDSNELKECKCMSFCDKSKHEAKLIAWLGFLDRPFVFSYKFSLSDKNSLGLTLILLL